MGELREGLFVSSGGTGLSVEGRRRGRYGVMGEFRGWRDCDHTPFSILVNTRFSFFFSFSICGAGADRNYDKGFPPLHLRGFLSMGSHIGSGKRSEGDAFGPSSGVQRNRGFGRREGKRNVVGRGHGCRYGCSVSRVLVAVGAMEGSFFAWQVWVVVLRWVVSRLEEL